MGIKREEHAYVAALIEIKLKQFVEVLKEVAKVLDEFVDTMLEAMPSELLPCHAIDHKI